MNAVLRISFLLARGDNPRLYDELVQFPKGQRRANRLRTIAFEGLLLQSLRQASVMEIARDQGVAPISSESNAERSEASLELFSDPAVE